METYFIKSPLLIHKMKLFITFFIAFIPQILLAQNFEINVKIIDPDNKFEEDGVWELATFTRNSLAGKTRIYKANMINKQAIISDTISVSEVAMLSLSFGPKFVSYKVCIDPGATYHIAFDVPNKKFDVSSNSKTDNLMHLFFDGLDSLNEIKDSRIASHKQFLATKNDTSADSVFKLIQNFDNDTRNFKKKIARENPDNIISPYILIKNYRFDLEEQKIYENLTDEIKNTSYGVALKESIDGYLKDLKPVKQAELVSESLIPIAGSTLSEEKIILNEDYFKKNKNKLTLVEFWASWCAPCKQSLKDLYSFYYSNKSKNFNVVLVSLDDDSKSWEKASLVDNYPWINISDGKGQSSEIPKNYKINAIPANILVNAEGKIIARNITDLNVINKILDK
ncbi:MAG: TlpA family protein disulfide reductase [Pedobacter sp.]|nr:MAG: TlpA family protein disulfide reductase [Pedobacter sp.]